ncbi:hypothetical protein TNCV_2687431 [Trichonephila clavipes]|nr:hypothetical protein TNCV_2687431 [Trichonephila clavipes]
MTSQRYAHDILLPHVLSLMQRYPEAFFRQDNARPPTARVYIAPPGGAPHSLRNTELGAWLQQKWNEMSQDIV